MGDFTYYVINNRRIKQFDKPASSKHDILRDLHRRDVDGRSTTYVQQSRKLSLYRCIRTLWKASASVFFLSTFSSRAKHSMIMSWLKQRRGDFCRVQAFIDIRVEMRWPRRNKGRASQGFLTPDYHVVGGSANKN